MFDANSRFPQSPSIGGGPVAPQQPDIYSRYGGQPMVDSNPNLDGFQPPTSSPMQPPAQVPMPTPGMPGGKSERFGPGGIGGIITPFNPGPQIGGGPAPLDPNAPNPLGPHGQQSVAPQPPAGTSGGKSGVSPGVAGGPATQLTPGQLQAFSNSIFGTPGSSNQSLDPNRVLL